MSDCKIFRLSASEPRKIVGSLQGLYNVDISAFKKDDQYGPDLLKLVLLQPEAFWVAELDNIVIGYLSMFTFKSDRLYKNLLKEAKQGILDLPDLIGEYNKDLISKTNEQIRNVHLYIDAIAVPKVKNGITIQTSQVRKELIDSAKNDFAWVNKASLCVIAVRPSISHLINKLGVPLDHAGGRRESIVGDKKYRELFCSHDISGKQLNIIMEGLKILKNIRFGIRFGYDQFRGTPTVAVIVEPKD